MTLDNNLKDIITFNWYLSISTFLCFDLDSCDGIAARTMQESYCFFHSSRPRFLAATRFYYPGRGSSQFSLASHNSPAELLLGKHRRDTQRARHELVASQRELPLILRVWQSAGGVSSSLCRFLECHYRSRMGLLETIRPSPRWRRIVDEKKRRILTIRVINY